MPFAPLPGRWLTTDGRDASSAEAVVNVLLKSSRLLPERSRTSLVAATVTTLEAGSVPPDSVTERLS